jgi:hypothetical protein
VYLLYYMCTAVFTLDAGLLARSQYSEGPATGHLDTGFSWFPYVYKQTLRWFPRFQVATTCFSYSHLDLNLLVTNFIFCIHLTTATGRQPNAVNYYYYYYYYYYGWSGKMNILRILNICCFGSEECKRQMQLLWRIIKKKSYSYII